MELELLLVLRVANASGPRFLVSFVASADDVDVVVDVAGGCD